MDLQTSHSIRKKRNFKGHDLTVDATKGVGGALLGDQNVLGPPSFTLTDLHKLNLSSNSNPCNNDRNNAQRLSNASSLLGNSIDSKSESSGDSRRTSSTSTVGGDQHLSHSGHLSLGSHSRSSKSHDYDIGQTITAANKPAGLGRRGSENADEDATDLLAQLYLDATTMPGTTAAAAAGSSRSHSSLSSHSQRSGDRDGLNEDDMTELGDIGRGNGGVVTRVRHEPTGRIMACKMVMIDNKPAVMKQIKRELEILSICTSPHIVTYYGHIVKETKVSMYMEFMDAGSLDVISRRLGALDVRILGQIVLAVLEGLIYLYDERRIMHRDVKPSNILINSRGQIKLCDFGVSGELVNSIADTFVGTSTYMSPERIRGNNQYGINSDIWSLGIALVELGTGGFPYSAAPDSDEEDEILKAYTAQNAKTQVKKAVPRPTLSILELLQTIIHEPAPRLPSHFPPDAIDFVDKCLIKEPEVRPGPKDLLRHPFYLSAKRDPVDLVAWANSIKK